MTFKDATIKTLTAAVLGAGLAMYPLSADADVDAPEYKMDTFHDWDADQSGALDFNEYRTFAFSTADWDNDGVLEDTEWVKYTEFYYDPFDLRYEAFSYYDTDGDGFIERTEFTQLPHDDLYSLWDYDDNDYVDMADWDHVTAYYTDYE